MRVCVSTRMQCECKKGAPRLHRLASLRRLISVFVRTHSQPLSFSHVRLGCDSSPVSARMRLPSVENPGRRNAGRGTERVNFWFLRFFFQLNQYSSEHHTTLKCNGSLEKCAFFVHWMLVNHQQSMLWSIIRSLCGLWDSRNFDTKKRLCYHVRMNLAENPLNRNVDGSISCENI